MENLRSKFLKEDKEIHYIYDRIISLNLVVNSKDEIITAHRNKIQLFSNELYILKKEIITKVNLRDILLIDDDLIVATEFGGFERYKRINDFDYSLVSQKIIDKDIDFRYIIKLDKKNMICAFSKTNIYIINIDLFSVDCKFSLPEKLYMDARTKPFILSEENHTICFRQTNSLTIFNYKKMEITKTIDLIENSPFQLYKEEKDNFFYMISIFLSLKGKDRLGTHIQAIKYDLNLNILENSKTEISMPLQSYDYDEVGGINWYNHFCVYRCIVQNINNYSIILHGYGGPPYEDEDFHLFECKNGKIQTFVNRKNQCIITDSYADYVFMKNKDKIISAFAGKNDDKITFQQ